MPDNQVSVLGARTFDAATVMRDKCVSVVKAMRDVAQPTDFEATIWNRIISRLSSLTLDTENLK